MTIQLSQNVLAMKEYKAVLEEASGLGNPCSETGHLCYENELLPRPVWFKGSRDRGLRRNNVAETSCQIHNIYCTKHHSNTINNCHGQARWLVSWHDGLIHCLLN